MPKVKYIDKACAGLQEMVGDLDNYSLDNPPPPNLFYKFSGSMHLL